MFCKKQMAEKEKSRLHLWERPLSEGHRLSCSLLKPTDVGPFAWQHCKDAFMKLILNKILHHTWATALMPCQISLPGLVFCGEAIPFHLGYPNPHHYPQPGGSEAVVNYDLEAVIIIKLCSADVSLTNPAISTHYQIKQEGLFFQCTAVFPVVFCILIHWHSLWERSMQPQWDLAFMTSSPCHWWNKKLFSFFGKSLRLIVSWLLYLNQIKSVSQHNNVGAPFHSFPVRSLQTQWAVEHWHT